MATAKPKKGNIRITVSIPETLDVEIRKHYFKQGDYSNFVIDALNQKLHTTGEK
jgi:hypothetical protein